VQPPPLPLPFRGGAEIWGPTPSSSVQPPSPTSLLQSEREVQHYLRGQLRLPPLLPPWTKSPLTCYNNTYLACVATHCWVKEVLEMRGGVQHFNLSCQPSPPPMIFPGATACAHPELQAPCSSAGGGGASTWQTPGGALKTQKRAARVKKCRFYSKPTSGPSSASAVAAAATA
jgi:hypothetical protein